MKNLIKDKMFVIGFFCGNIIFLFISGTVQSYNRGTSLCFDCIEYYGFPFTYLETGGYVSITKIYWFGLSANILIATIFSFVIGLIFRFIWSKFTSKQLK